MERRRVLGAAAVLALLAGACSTGEGVELDGSDGPSSPSEGSTGGVLKAAIAGEPDQLDPHRTSAYFSFQVLENVFDTLVEPDENLEMQPALAESWEVSDDQLTWTFTLREGVEFHDGSPMTADDVVYSYRRIIDDELANAWRLSAITDVEATDDLTVTIRVASPTPNLLSSLGGFKGVAIVQEANVASGDITTAPIGTGPFRVDRYVSGDHIELSANADHWAGAPQLQGIEFRFISEASTALNALRADEIQWTDVVPPQQVESLGTEEGIQLGVTPSTDYWYLALNQEREPWNDVRVRQAIAYAIDRDAIVQAVSYGTAQQNQLAIPSESVWYSDYAPYTHDLQQAEQLLEDAGAEGLTLDFLATSEYPETVTAAQVIASNLEPLGIEVNIRQPDFSTWLDEQNSGNFDILMMGWLGNIDPDDFYYAQHHSDGASNAQGYANPEVDALLEEGRNEIDPEARREAYTGAARLIADDASYIYLYNPSVIQAWSPNVSGYEPRADRAIRFRDVALTD